MQDHRFRPILEVLDNLYHFSPIKVCFNGFELYNDYDSMHDLGAGVYGETQSPEKVIPERLRSVLENHDVYVNRLEIIMVHGHHSLVYMFGEKIKKGYLDEKV